MSTTPSQDALKKAAEHFMAAGEVARIADLITMPLDPLHPRCREAQNALRAAYTAADNAIRFGYITNRVLKAGQGKNASGRWQEATIDNLRSAILFSGAGVDRAMKALVEDTLPILLETDVQVQEKLTAFATQAISDADQGVDPKMLVRLLLGRGKTPQDILAGNWARHLTNGSAQSAERMDEIAAALGVIDPPIRKLLASSTNRTALTPLQAAFVERNRVAHELDITKPSEDVRAPLERIRRSRSPDAVRKNCVAMLDAAQQVVNDVAVRLPQLASNTP